MSCLCFFKILCLRFCFLRGGSQCVNEGGNEITVNGNGNGKVDSQQTIVQSNQCADGATCINSAGNVYVIGNLKKTG